MSTQKSKRPPKRTVASRAKKSVKAAKQKSVEPAAKARKQKPVKAKYRTVPVAERVYHGRPGQPTKFNDDVAERAIQFALKGCTESGIAALCGIGYSTFCEWKVRHPEFGEAIKAAKEKSDEEVVEVLRKKAMGLCTTEKEVVLRGKKVKLHDVLPPSDTALIFWLKNRKPKDFRDQQHTAMSGKVDGPATIAKVIVTLPANGREAPKEDKTKT